MQRDNHQRNLHPWSRSQPRVLRYARRRLPDRFPVRFPDRSAARYPAHRWTGGVTSQRTDVLSVRSDGRSGDALLRYRLHPREEWRSVMGERSWSQVVRNPWPVRRARARIEGVELSPIKAVELEASRIPDV